MACAPGTVGARKAEREALRREMAGLGCTLETVAREMSRRWKIRPREAYRHARGWSQDEVARRFACAAARIEALHIEALLIEALRIDVERTPPRTASAAISGVRVGEYERWPRGGRRPSVYALLVLAEVLTTSVDQLLDYQDHRGLPDTDRTVLAALHEASPGKSVLAAGGLSPGSGARSRRAS